MFVRKIVRRVVKGVRTFNRREVKKVEWKKLLMKVKKLKLIKFLKLEFFK